MQITTNFDVTFGMYLVELSAGNVTDKTRNELAEAVGNDSYFYILVTNLLVVNAQKRANDGERTTKQAVDDAAKEYTALGFGRKFCSFTYMEHLAEIVIDRTFFATVEPAELLLEIKDCLEQGEHCPYDPIKNGILLYTLRLILRFGLATIDMNFTTKLMGRIGALTQEEKDNAIIPSCFVQEI